MSRWTQKCKGLLLAVSMGVLILDSRAAFSGSYEGLQMCLQSVIPCLLPFMVLSPVFTGWICGRNLRVLRPISRLLGLPTGCEGILIIGCLGGYPVGAQCIAQAVQTGKITSSVGKRMLGFCCNCGPGFIFGICAGFFKAPFVPWALWGFHIAGALVAGIMLPGTHTSAAIAEGREISLPEAMPKAIHNMAQVCGWVIVFRCLLEFANRWFLRNTPVAMQVFITGILELTNGCCILNRISSDGLRFILCEAMLSFGGICVAMQTASVCGNMGLGMYFPGKLIQTFFSVFFAWSAISLQQGSWIKICALWSLMLCSGFFFRKYKKGSGKLLPMGV